MKKSKRALCLIMAVCLLAACFGGCGDSEPESGRDDLKQKIAEQKDGNNTQKTEAEAVSDTPETPQNLVEADLMSEDAIRKFLAGEWAFLNTETGEDAATVIFQEDGSLTFTRLDDQATCTGTISFQREFAKPEENMDYFRLQLSGLKQFAADDDYVQPSDEDETSGKFYIGCGEEEDYLFLNEIGNGDTFISLRVLNLHDLDYEGKWAEWLFHRKHAETKQEPEETQGDFFAWVWKKDGDEVTLQKMIPHTYDTFEEYTDYAFIGAYFSEEAGAAVSEYELAAPVDTKLFFNERTWDSLYPLDMYHFTTNADGKITAVSEVDKAFYGVYDMGLREPEFSYDQRMFTCNNGTFDMEDIAPAVTAIMDCTKAGDWIVVEGHVNPRRSVYALYNVQTGYFEYEITGTNLIYRNYDLSTAVYAFDNEVHDIYGHYLGSVQDGEIYSLSFKNDTTVEAECWRIENGEEVDFTQEFEYEAPDRAMFAYYEYLLSHSARDWREFVSMGGTDASAFLMVDPPDFYLDRMAPKEEIEKNALDTVAVVSLENGETVQIIPDKEAPPGNGSEPSETYECDKSKNVVFSVTAPEGMPCRDLVIRTKDGSSINWPIMPLSGRIRQMSTFLAK
ncbi:MAG: hypothetical protein K6E16_10550 [Lachnospiraceae bacterium]|nr:hypothetical protein [Lachnospiraceae bacterium]